MALPTVKSITARPARPTRELLDTIDILANRVIQIGNDISTPIALLDEQRGALIQRGRELMHGLRVTDQKRENAIIAAAIGKMLALFSGGREMDAQTIKNNVAGYVEALQKLPGWAVEEACARFIRGEVIPANPQHLPNPKYGPTTAELCIETKRITDALWAEQAKIRRVLKARLQKVISPEEKERLDKLTTSWLNRTDPVARKLDPQVSTEEAKRAEAERFLSSLPMSRDEWESKISGG